MARKGSRKVRTGCITCKIRKVKCDETKPSCTRCLSTGRKCDGYQQPPPTAKAVLEVPTSQPHRVFYGVTSQTEGRALQYFCETVGPFLSGTVDPYFWTHIVMQFSTFEPSVRHSLIAISNLYEQIEGSAQPQRRLYLQDQSFALQHYNAAINELKAIQTRDKQPIVLIVCVLFICIEFLQSNREAAVRHCKHGVAILRSVCRDFSWMEEHLLPLFRRLVELSFFFGEKSDCSDLEGLERPIPEYFPTYHDAQLMIDDVYNRTFQFVKRLDPYRSGLARDTPVPGDVLDSQSHINYLLDVWHELFSSLNSRVSYDSAATDAEDDRQKLLRGFLITRYECCRIWLNLALCGDECGFDRYLDNFKRVAKALKATADEISPDTRLRHLSSLSPKFSFETGFLPMLFSIVCTCRHFETRLQILQLMPLLSLPRESLWEMDSLVAVARRMVEIEHAIVLDAYLRPVTLPPTSWPPRNTRVIDVSMDAENEQRWVRGERVTGKVVGFHQRNSDGGVDLFTEFVVIRSSPPEEVVPVKRRALIKNDSSNLKAPQEPRWIEPALIDPRLIEADQFLVELESQRTEMPKSRMKSVAGAYSWDVNFSKSTRGEICLV
ncbi:hypothetical protein CGLO_11110 [Colletotrichum gloeosporioides Cg-14]|uniref:Zn(2)-C6 fungal-type domain-containing protein n=1 Tax=Colletotrichum gloeosporioides (strain Cg-14) TaxID=1237896 RepID=T0LMT9_COLGC|nr:hypothetical protein CGLO_11110 [Colletotrichum gloeosporioides Cg-14]